MGLQWVIKDSTGFPCYTPLGPAYSTNNKLVHSMTPFQDFPTNQDCQSALQGATAIGLQSLWGNISFCIDDVQLLSSTVESQGATCSSCPSGSAQELFVACSKMLLLHESAQQWERFLKLAGSHCATCLSLKQHNLFWYPGHAAMAVLLLRRV